MRDAFGHPQTVVVLGGTSEIGEAIVKDLIGLQARTVVLAGRNADLLAGAAERARLAGAERVATVVCEATEPGRAEAAVDECFAVAGAPVDLVLVTVGLLGEQEEDEADPARVARMMTVNVTWPAAALTAAVSRLRTQGAGRVVVLSSVAGVRVRRANYVYGSAKAGLDAFALGAAEAVRDTGGAVQVQVVRPGFVHSKMTAGRPAAPFATTPDVVAAAVVRGLQGNETVIWVPPVLRPVFGVFRLLPQALWRRMPG